MSKIFNKNGNLKTETEYLQIAAQNNATMTNYVKVNIDKTQQNKKCTLRSDRGKTINDKIIKCSKFMQKSMRQDTTGGEGYPLGIAQEI